MNSLTELNSFNAGFSLPFTDSRLANVLFDRLTAAAQTQTADKGIGFAAPVAINIIDIANAAVSLPTFSIDLFNLVGASVTWPNLPAGVTSSVPSTRVYRVSGLASSSDWETVKSPTINLPANYTGTFTYTSTIAYYSATAGNQTVSFTTTVTVLNIDFLTSTTDFIYTDGTDEAITGQTSIINVDASYPGVTWTIIATPNVTSSITTWTTTGSGGSFAVNGSTKVITISGTRAQVNSRLAGLKLSTNTNAFDFTLTYAMTNSLNGNTDSVVHVFKSFDLTLLSSVSAFNYTEDSKNIALTGYPVITDATRDGSGTYTLTITPSAVGAIEFIRNASAGANDTFNSSTKVLTLSGTRSQINTRLANLYIWFGEDFTANFTLSYFLNNPIDLQKTKNQLFQCNVATTEVENMSVTRSFLAGQQNLIFSSSTPYISDTDVSGTNTEFYNPATDSYTITLFTTLGQWAYLTDIGAQTESALASTLTITGTKAYINDRFSTIRFYPTFGTTSSGTFTYTQSKNGIQQVSQSVSLTFTGTATFTARTVNFDTVGTTSWTPTREESLYGKITDLLVVGGGGGGSKGGGGGGQVKEVTNISLNDQTYSIVVGVGGNREQFAVGIEPGGNGDSSSAFGVTALGGQGAQGASGGGSYAPDGTFNAGGTGPGRAFSGPDNGLGGGGAGSGNEPSVSGVPTSWPPTAGGRITYDEYQRFTTALNATQFPGPGINTRNSTGSGLNAQASNGGLGAVLTGFFKIASGSGHLGTNNTGYGYGGGGGNTYFTTAPSGGNGGYRLGDYQYGKGILYNTQNGVYFIYNENPLTVDVAGGGGGGGSTFRQDSPQNGMRGIVRIRLGAK